MNAVATNSAASAWAAELEKMDPFILRLADYFRSLSPGDRKRAASMATRQQLMITDAHLENALRIARDGVHAMPAVSVAAEGSPLAELQESVPFTAALADHLAKLPEHEREATAKQLRRAHVIIAEAAVAKAVELAEGVAHV